MRSKAEIWNEWVAGGGSDSMTRMSPQSCLGNPKSGARSQAGKTGQAALGEFRDQGPAVPQHPPPDVLYLRGGHCLENFKAILSPWTANDTAPLDSPQTPPPDLRGGKEMSLPSSGTWGSHSPPLSLSVPPIKWRVVILLRVGPPTSSLVVAGPLQQQGTWGSG